VILGHCGAFASVPTAPLMVGQARAAGERGSDLVAAGRVEVLVMRAQAAQSRGRAEPPPTEGVRT
jgi:hypothetical protein